MKFRLVILLFFCALSTAFTQEELPDSELEVVKLFNARLANAEKLSVRPRLPKADTSVIPVSGLQATLRPADITYSIPGLRPLAIRDAELTSGRNTYLSLGGGLPNALSGAGAYYFDTDNDATIGIQGDFLTQADFDNPLKKFTDWNLRGDGSYLSESGLLINGQVGYRNEDLFAYGFNNALADSTENENDYLIRYKLFDAMVSLSNFEETDVGFNYEISLDYSRIADNRFARENNTTFSADAQKKLGNKGFLKGRLETALTSFSDTMEEKRNLNIHTIGAAYAFTDTRFSFTAGAQFQLNRGDIFVFPNIEFTYPLQNAALIAYLDLNGGLYKNNFFNSTRYNPFLTSIPDSMGISNKLGATLGIRGKLELINFDASVSYTRIRNMATFLRDDLDSLAFDLLYDDANVITLSGGADVELESGVSLSFSVAGRFFDMSQFDRPWHIPAVDLRVQGTYPIDRFTFHGSLTTQSAPYFQSESGSSRSLDALLDISAGASYKISSVFNAFVNINNILNQERLRWQGYDTIGINGLIGLTAIF